MLRHRGYTGYMIAKENTSGFIPELQIVEESIYEDAMAIVEQRKKENEQRRSVAQSSYNKTLLAGNLYCCLLYTSYATHFESQSWSGFILISLSEGMLEASFTAFYPDLCDTSSGWLRCSLSVSYTHLDVYKRQGQHHGAPQLLRADGKATSRRREAVLFAVEEIIGRQHRQGEYTVQHAPHAHGERPCLRKELGGLGIHILNDPHIACQREHGACRERTPEPQLSLIHIYRA